MNVVALVGRLVADPEVRHTQTGVAVTQIRVAVQRPYKNNNERVSDFIDVVAWRQTAEFICKYFKKGQMIGVNGSIQTRNYTDNNGNKRYVVEVLADNVHFTESRANNSGGGDYSNNNNNYSNNGGNYNNSYNNAPAQPQYNEPAPAYSSGDMEDFEVVVGDDDLPF